MRSAPDNEAVDLLARSMGGPSREVMALGTLLKSRLGRFHVLDLGSGAGRNAIYLAGLGALVTAVDASDAHVEALNEIARRIGVDLTAVHARAEQYSPRDDLDLVLCHGILHFISTPMALEVIARLQSKTRLGGIHVITIATFDDKNHIPESFIGQSFDGALRPQHLVQAYDGWRCVAHESYVKRDHHPNDGYHLHPIEKMIFQRPGGEDTAALNVDKHRLLYGDRPDVRTFLQTDKLTRTSSAAAIAALGPPDFSFTTTSAGTQLSFNGVREQGHELVLMFWAQHAAYFENDVLVGYSVYVSDCFHTFHSLSRPPRLET
ncbi:MAG: class I SAM-dependent methyltransferase [Candidatus Accumulibacter sp.]|jgi:SAM-dependent methyltransferase|uniref:class I SAM-dependent methyltransferase n=1 Tax=Accumulibacter sp. TaxID=2053492 RepID=UPI001AD4545C|nr:class I SAM-dependent methyltransferase [Accumulibacter sp.]MBN8439527.1 class I SAM-dependent methyltransferase [Accumulibacter sp.]